jgi:hypothetical protein
MASLMSLKMHEGANSKDTERTRRYSPRPDADGWDRKKPAPRAKARPCGDKTSRCQNRADRGRPVSRSSAYISGQMGPSHITLSIGPSPNRRGQIPGEAGSAMLEKLNGRNLAKYLNSVALRQRRPDCEPLEPQDSECW